MVFGGVLRAVNMTSDPSAYRRFRGNYKLFRPYSVARTVFLETFPGIGTLTFVQGIQKKETKGIEMKKFIVLVLLLWGFPGFPQTTKSLQNLDKNGVAIQGYDPVAFFTQNKPVKGSAEFQSDYKGATYYFASAEDKNTFDAAPAKYEPQFGGYCAYGVSQGHLAPVKIEAFQIVNGRLLMQYDLDVKKTFNKDQSGNLDKAEKNWAGLVEKKGR